MYVVGIIGILKKCSVVEFVIIVIKVGYSRVVLSDIVINWLIFNCLVVVNVRKIGKK